MASKKKLETKKEEKMDKGKESKAEQKFDFKSFIKSKKKK